MIFFISGIIIFFFLFLSIKLQNKKKKSIEEKRIEMTMKLYENKRKEFLKNLMLEKRGFFKIFNFL